ncbi:MAG: hypothetical protein A3I44_06280 [Candidatus Sungbacteria bacterium RIFCSPLOWO2_02_FULL_51_17]|uniref:Uncharacterized protein n=1 Tax=Candidatus Sungbacteria bacterium RIFCSPHIGHO2_02_FULL_51_29 TaxID=1802273 RepID=A0A1G2KUS4_9BACT|nr:MAG: hypothetical protein A2676_04595 [Candidatus Sungbacteria bacterium RIFCSPHIGHO2_01_FULL_51_22]OHA02159.1 MAG: hypothetical protein A3C16_05520 [Candidatus Sungbacteria bacterium RIFCSPHIGHO2_02_FULL_51_29]OHA06444.1 MAG: hypothetical protein A3B29_04745 [Candidatus Sungbacteria bacterium RIFCSPLOWO2_01_FULL_51_34]OHA10382.1 MAG: hypothetical protein A3I44_06280 [Candidatus Sungbacteria bacterium RIFCSPLOWO2_02_FULL_51_17]
MTDHFKNFPAQRVLEIKKSFFTVLNRYWLPIGYRIKKNAPFSCIKISPYKNLSYLYNDKHLLYSPTHTENTDTKKIK